LGSGLFVECVGEVTLLFLQQLFEHVQAVLGGAGLVAKKNFAKVFQLTAGGSLLFLGHRITLGGNCHFFCHGQTVFQLKLNTMDENLKNYRDLFGCIQHGLTRVEYSDKQQKIHRNGCESLPNLWGSNA
jgi:hypothetical protein